MLAAAGQPRPAPPPLYFNKAATPKAYGDCGEGALPESGVQGQVPLADQQSGASKAGARCNFRPVGESNIENRGSNFQMGWYKQCAYVGQVGTREFQSSDALDGVAVVDVSDPAKPQFVRFVLAPTGISQHEAVEVNQARGMLVVQTGGLAAQYVDVYDVSQDCRNPVFKGRYDGGGPIFHGQRVSPDGKTVYATDFTGAYSAMGGVMHVIDVSDMANPRLLMKWDATQEGLPAFGVHDLDISPDGRRLYLGAVDPTSTVGALVAGGPSNQGPSAVILDVGDIQDRKADPDPKVVSQLHLPNFGHTEQLARIGGRQYLITSGETPFGGANNCPWAWGNIVDISDERAPKVVSEIKLEVNEQANCGQVGPDAAVYSIHYIGVDDVDDTTMVFYTYYTGGVRVFDVRDPAQPKEIAYYHPPPVPGTAHPPWSPGDGDTQKPAWDSATSDLRYFPDTRRLWFVSIGRGFQVIELTAPLAHARAAAPPRTTPRRCTSRRTVTITLPRGLRSARVTYAGRRARVTRRGARLRARVVLSGLPDRTVRVRVVGRSRSGRLVRQTRTFRTCRRRS
jgi:hypothetical protein